MKEYNNQRTINDKIPFTSQNPKILTTIKLDSYFVRRTNNKDDKNIKNKINTSTTNTNTTLLLQYNNNNNDDIEPNKEPPNTDYTEITTEYIESNNNPKNVIIKNNSSSNNNKNYNISVSRNISKKEQKKKNSKPDEDKNYSRQKRVTSNQPHIKYKQEKELNQVREQIKERIQYISEGIQKIKDRNKIKTFEIRKKIDHYMQRRTTTVERKWYSMQ